MKVKKSHCLANLAIKLCDFKMDLIKWQLNFGSRKFPPKSCLWFQIELAPRVRSILISDQIADSTTPPSSITIINHATYESTRMPFCIGFVSINFPKQHEILKIFIKEKRNNISSCKMHFSISELEERKLVRLKLQRAIYSTNINKARILPGQVF